MQSDKTRQAEIEARIRDSAAIVGGGVLDALARFREAVTLGLDEFQAVAYAIFGVATNEAGANAQQKSVIGGILGKARPSAIYDAVSAAQARVDEAKARLDAATVRAQQTGAIPSGLSVDSVGKTFDWLTTKGFVFGLGIVVILVAIMLYRENS